MSNVVKMPQTQPDLFDEFWQLYPRHMQKKAARALWDKITNGGLETRTLIKDSGSFVPVRHEATPQQIIDGARRFRKKQTDPLTYKIKDEGRFIPYPTTWLNGGCWEDE